MAQPYVTGPAHLYAGVGAGGAPFFIGHAMRTPRITIRPHFSPVWCDLTGQTVPYDWIFDGEEGFVTYDVSRWNEAGYAALAARPRATGARGITLPGDIGSLMITELFAYQLWVVFPYAAKPAYASMPPGYHFLNAWLEGPDELDDLGTTARRNRLVFHCGRSGVITTSPTGGQGLTLTLYDTLVASFTGLPSIN
jgi:hypothetical protein